jgi:hypothetical protein
MLMTSCKLQLEVKLKLKIYPWNEFVICKPYIQKLKLLSCMLVIFIAIDPVELQALREFGSEADFVPP